MEPLSKQPGKVSGLENPHRSSYCGGARLGRYEICEKPSWAKWPGRLNWPCARSRGSAQYLRRFRPGGQWPLSNRFYAL